MTRVWCASKTCLALASCLVLSTSPVVKARLCHGTLAVDRAVAEMSVLRQPDDGIGWRGELDTTGGVQADPMAHPDELYEDALDLESPKGVGPIYRLTRAVLLPVLGVAVGLGVWQLAAGLSR